MSFHSCFIKTSGFLVESFKAVKVIFLIPQISK